MGLLDSLIGGALGQGGAGGQGDLLGMVAGMLGNDAPGGGLAGLVRSFQQGGLGEVIQSWISTGQNLPISADQLGGVLDSDLVRQMAGKAGLSTGDLMGQLSQMLPQVVDKLTPQGSLPEGGLGNIGDLLGQLMRPR